MAPQHITLTGFMATGKSEVAELVAQKLGWTAVSGDALLTERHGASPDALIATRGEAAFRRLEAELYVELASRDEVVVASGGGSLVLDETRRAFAEAGIVVCLEATPETIVERIEGQVGGDTRPMIGAVATDASREVDAAAHAKLLARTRRDTKLERLSPRERDVLALMAEGLGNSAIAERLVVTDGAVHKHIRSIFAKLDLSPDDRADRRVTAVLRYLEDTQGR